MIPSPSKEAKTARKLEGLKLEFLDALLCNTITVSHLEEHLQNKGLTSLEPLRKVGSGKKEVNSILIMAKRSQRRTVRYEKDQSGCMWGFISMFDFRHGRAARKLIADKRRGSKQSVGSVHSKNKFEMLSTLDENCQGNLESRESKRLTVTSETLKPSVKKLMEEEMFIDQETGNAEVISKESRSGHEDTLKIDTKRKKKSRKKSCDMDTNDLNLDINLKSDLSNSQHSRQQSKNDLDLDKVLEDLSRLKSAFSVMHDREGEADDEQSNQKRVIAENKARDAILEFVNQMIFNGNDLEEARKFLCSHELMDVLQILSSDKELFLRLLQDPKSLLLKYVQEFINAQGSDDKEHRSVIGSNLSECEPGNLRQTTETVNHKQRNFFRKMVKSRTKNQISGNENTESSNRIVILKPGSIGMRNSEAEINLSHSLHSYEGPSVRVGSHFSLTEIKKKLKHAMGKERDRNPERIAEKVPAECQRKGKGKGSKVIGKDNVGMKSPNKDHFFIEKIAKPTFMERKVGMNGTLKDSEVIVEHENGSYPKQKVSNKYNEAKKHTSEMLGSEDENLDLSCRKVSKSLGRILSLPDYNLSPLGSPGRDWEHRFVTAHTRFNGSKKNWEANEDISSPKQTTFMGHLDQATHSTEKQSSICDDCSNNKVQEIKSELNFSSDLIHDDKAEATSYHVRDEIVAEGNVESVKEKTALDSSSETVGLIEEKDQNCDMSELSDGARHSQCLSQDFLDENQSPSSPQSSPSHSSIFKKIEELESGADVSGRPSPVSVLDKPFPEDDIGLGNTGSHLVKNQIQPLQIQFEEQESSHMDQIHREKQGFEEKQLIFDYIEAVLQASGFGRDQLWIKCISTDQILDPSLNDQVEFFSNQLCLDKNLLFDCVNDILMEVCRYYFGVSTCVSFVKTSKIRPTPTMERIILEACEGVCWNLLPLPPPHTLDQIVRRDMARSRTWMDLGFDAEIVGFEMGEAILAELMEDTILSCVSESPASTCSQIQSDFIDKDNSNDK
ncbi:uncharacterized protein G2W53_001420 [Senna tora]|uniref:Uncharacterized protein n=1 Tax=Senna tora TaxID=362788 RepID=A0A835CLH3_9FABA|nr:uncharacterized protein G2W53_001420 [Senna tora]